MDKEVSTLVGTEQRLAPFVYAVQCLCATAGLMALGYAIPRSDPTLIGLCSAAWLCLTLSNVRYLLRNGKPTVGMMPVSVASLAPALLPTLTTTQAADALFLVCAVTSALSLVCIAVMLRWFWRLHDACSPTVPIADDAVVIVLGGSIRDGKPKETLALRLDAAHELWTKHPRARFVLTGGPVTGETLTEAEAMERYLYESGLPKDSMLLETKARNTQENIAYSLELIHANDLQAQLCVLSSDFHLFRARMIGQEQGVDLVPIPAPTPAPCRLQQWCREVLTILAKC